MNKRIEELAGMAKTMTEENINRKISKNVELDAFTEKFAELIIKECAGLTLDYKNNQHYNGWLDYRDEILNHFGVK